MPCRMLCFQTRHLSNTDRECWLLLRSKQAADWRKHLPSEVTGLCSIAGGLSWGEYKYEHFYLYETLPANHKGMSVTTCSATHQYNTGASDFLCGSPQIEPIHTDSTNRPKSMNQRYRDGVQSIRESFTAEQSGRITDLTAVPLRRHMNTGLLWFPGEPATLLHHPHPYITPGLIKD